ncbi:hypothetical protein V8D89_010059 [Ganoderma adspersum]
MVISKQDTNVEKFRQPEQLQYLRSSIVAKPPYCQGTLALPESDFTLLYGTEGNAQRINLSRASAAQLQHLADACTPATFGVGGEDVYDETYRKAGKLDSKDFAITFDPSRSCLVDVIRNELLVENPNKVESEDLNIELYKLNVYGQDAFFKAHVDTPRSELMFGSLVIVFPTPHEGGAIKLRAPEHGEGEGETRSEWTFDSSALLAQQPEDRPSIAYVAFFSDVEHEVMPVTSGHRVTITYNLYYAPDESERPPPELAPISTNERSFKSALRAALTDQAFLPTGGNLMFSLRHQYPLASHGEPHHPFHFKKDDAARAANAQAREAGKAALQALEPRLKASDGVMLQVLRECAVDASLKIVYEASDDNEVTETVDRYYIMADRVLPLPKTSVGYADEYLVEQGGERVQDAVLCQSRSMVDHEDHGAPVYWVEHPRLPSGKGFRETFATYGNESALGVVYWRVWIFARLGPAGQRGTAQPSQQ